MTIILIGFKNCGKTYLGKKLAENLGLSFFDTDQILEEKMQLSCFEIYQTHGESFFREIESQVLQDLQEVKNSIIATGGGIVFSLFNRQILSKLGKIVYLNLPKYLLFKRWQEGKPSFITNKEDFDSLYFEREPLYQKIADEKIDLCDDNLLNLNQLLSICGE